MLARAPSSRQECTRRGHYVRADGTELPQLSYLLMEGETECPREDRGSDRVVHKEAGGEPAILILLDGDHCKCGEQDDRGICEYDVTCSIQENGYLQNGEYHRDEDHRRVDREICLVICSMSDVEHKRSRHSQNDIDCQVMALDAQLPHESPEPEEMGARRQRGASSKIAALSNEEP